MKKMNLLNTEEAGKVRGGRGSGIPPCKSIDARTCYYEFFPCHMRERFEPDEKDIFLD